MEIKLDRAKLFLKTPLVLLAFFVIAIPMLYRELHQYIGTQYSVYLIIGLILVALYFVKTSKTLNWYLDAWRNNKTVIEISDQGIKDSRTMTQPLRWDRIESIKIDDDLHKRRNLTIYLKKIEKDWDDQFAYKSEQNEVELASPLVLSLDYLKAYSVLIKDAINKHYQNALGSKPQIYQ